MVDGRLAAGREMQWTVGAYPRAGVRHSLSLRSIIDGLLARSVGEDGGRHGRLAQAGADRCARASGLRGGTPGRGRCEASQAALTRRCWSRTALSFARHLHAARRPSDSFSVGQRPEEHPVGACQRWGVAPSDMTRARWCLGRQCEDLGDRCSF